MFEKTKCILPCGSANYAIVMFTTVAQNVHLLPVYMLEDAYTTSLVNCVVNDALVHAVPNVEQMLLQFINTVQL